MSFTPHSQEELQLLDIQAGKSYLIQYANKDYFNGEDTIEEGKATPFISEGNIYFNVIDPYGMDKLIMQAKVLKSL